MVILVIQNRFGEAFAVFVAAGLTDGLDGLLARWLKQNTRIGAILDPIADKLLLSSSYIILAVMRIIPSWLAVVVLSRDLIIVSGVLILFLVQGGVEIKPSILGKLTTFMQLGTIFFVFLHHETGWLEVIIDPLFIATASATVISGLHYMALGAKLLNSEEEGHNG